MARTAREKARDRAIQRRESPVNYWHGRLRPLAVSDNRWRIVVLRGADSVPLNVTSIAESFDWQDASAILEGSLTLRLPPRRLDISEGHVVVCYHAVAGGPFREIWRMRISSPNVTASSRGFTVTLADDLKLLQRSKDDFEYRKSKRRPHGWWAHEIIADIARRYRFRVGRIPRSKHRILALSKKNASPYDAILAALLKEKTATGTRMRLAWRRDRLTVERLHRSRDMLVIGPMLMEATYAATMQQAFATVLSVHGTLSPKKGKRQKVDRVITSRRAVQRYGYIHAKFSADTAESMADLIDQGKRRLARIARPTRELTVTAPGSPTLRRGAALRVALEDLNIKALVYATEVRHQVTPGSYQMEVVCNFSDPYVDVPAAETKKKACANASKKGRKTKNCPAQGRARRPKPKKARQRTEKKR